MLGRSIYGRVPWGRSGTVTVIISVDPVTFTLTIEQVTDLGLSVTQQRAFEQGVAQILSKALGMRLEVAEGLSVTQDKGWTLER